MSQSPAPIDFYFDPISPYAWLAIRGLEKLATEIGRKILVKPILFAGLLNAHEQKGPAEVPAKRNYIFHDVMRRAAMQNIPFLCPPHHPFNPLIPLRIATAIEDEPLRLKFCTAVADAAWAGGIDISLLERALAVAAESGIEQKWAAERIQDSTVKQNLKMETASAIERGVFGVPSFYDQGELFWGNDSFETLRWCCRGNQIDESYCREILSRTASATRNKQ